MAVRRRLAADGYAVRRTSYACRVDSVSAAGSAGFAADATTRRHRVAADGYALRRGGYFFRTQSAQTYSDSVAEVASAGFVVFTRPRRRLAADGYAVRSSAGYARGGGSQTYSDTVQETGFASQAASSGSGIRRRVVSDGYVMRRGDYSGKTPAQVAVQRRNRSDFGGRIGSRQAA